MVIEEKTKKKLLNFNSDEDIYKQFERKCSYLSRLSGMKIDPTYYKLQYDIQEASMNDYVELQTQIYKTIDSKFPQLDFGMSGRLKSPFSYYEKIIKKYINLIEKDEFVLVEVLDDFAMKVFVTSINYPVDKISVDDDGIYIDSGPDEFRISEPNNIEYPVKNKLVTDAFEFDYNGRKITIIVEDGMSNVYVDNTIPYICTTINNEKVTFPLNSAITYKKSHKEDLVPYCVAIQEAAQDYLNSQGFVTKKRKDYIKHPKQSGYSSMQWSYYSKEQSLGLELQTKTYDMEAYSNWERGLDYKPNEHIVSSNSLDKIPRFVLTTKFPDGVHTLQMTEAECFEYIYHMTLKDYRKLMKANAEAAMETKTVEETVTRKEQEIKIEDTDNLQK